MQLKMTSKKEIVETGTTEQSGSGGWAKHTELLSEREFRERFGIPNGVSV